MNVNLDAKYELYINGQWVAPSGGKYFTTTNALGGIVAFAVLAVLTMVGLVA